MIEVEFESQGFNPYAARTGVTLSAHFSSHTVSSIGLIIQKMVRRVLLQSQGSASLEY